MDELANGLRTYRPNLEQYIFSSDRLRHNVQTWVDGVRAGKSSRALLLTGETGLGKTTLALAACQKLGADLRDVSEINCANLRTLEDARNLLYTLDIAPVHGDYRVLLLDEAHQMVPNAQQAFLTPIEKLSSCHIFICCTSNPSQLLPAFKGRFYEIPLENYKEEDIVDILAALPVKTKPSLISTIARISNGNPRRAIALLEKNLATENGEVELGEELLNVEQFVQAVLETNHKVAFLMASLVREDTRKIFFEKTLKMLEGAYLIRLGLSSALPEEEKAMITKAVKATGGHLIPELHGGLTHIMDKPLEQLRSFAMNLPYRPRPGHSLETPAY